jgi:hypothetical protein
VHDDAGSEALAESITQVAQAVEVARADGCGELGLDAGDRAIAGLDHQIDLASSGGSQVVEADIGVAPRRLLGELGGDEVLEQRSSERRLVGLEPALVVADERRGEAAVGKPELGCLDQALAEVPTPSGRASQ